jgi:hypothetical protein
VGSVNTCGADGRSHRRECHLDNYEDSLTDIFSNRSLYLPSPGKSIGRGHWMLKALLPFMMCAGDVGRSLADILVCTPGRLTDHLHFTPGFTLQVL